MQKMKYSGIEWIGEIPDNWDKIKIKNLCNKIYAGGTPSTDVFEYWDGDIPWLPSGVCHDNIIHQANIFITEKGYKNSSTKLIPKNTTIIAMTGATCANVGYITFDSCANQSVTAFVNNHNLLFSKYLFYTLQGAREYILTYQTGGAQAGINVENCRNLIIPITGIKEQKLIADFLDEKIDIIDKIIGDLNNQIEILNKYKKIHHKAQKNIPARNIMLFAVVIFSLQCYPAILQCIRQVSRRAGASAGKPSFRIRPQFRDSVRSRNRCLPRLREMSRPCAVRFHSRACRG